MAHRGRGVFWICRLGYRFPCLGAACAVEGPRNKIEDWTCFFPIGWQTSFDEPCGISFVFIYQAVQFLSHQIILGSVIHGREVSQAGADVVLLLGTMGHQNS